jgi:glycosyltransferase involved in cell wall biosynthesis
MKIAILTPTFSHFSGPDRVVERQALDFAKEGHKVTIFALGADIQPPKDTRLIKIGVSKNPFLQRIDRLLYFLHLFKINNYVKKLQHFDKIICHMYPMTLFAKKARKKYGIHYNYYNMGIAYPKLFKSILERIYMRFFSFLTKITVKGADSATSISQFLKKELKKETGVNGDVEHCKISSRFHPNVKPDNLIKKYDLKYPTFLYVGRISPHKGIHILIKAFKIIKREFPKAKLVIVGKHTFESYSKELKKIANKDKNIIFTGFVADEELPRYYTACDVYTTATLWEGFDLPAAESQACGKPVVAFNIGAHPEVIKNGMMVKAGDFVAFAKAVIETLKKK